MKKLTAIIICLVMAVSVLSAAASADAITVRVVNGDHTVNDGKFVIFMLDGADKDTYSYSVVDGVKINASIAVNEKGQPFIALKPEYVESLKLGEHKIEFVFNEHDVVSAKFSVSAVYDPYGNPKTGDESDIALWTAMLCMACGAAVTVGKKVYGK